MFNYFAATLSLFHLINPSFMFVDFNLDSEV